MLQNVLNGPEKDSKDKPVTKPSPRTNNDTEKSDPRKSNPNTPGKT